MTNPYTPRKVSNPQGNYKKNPNNMAANSMSVNGQQAPLKVGGYGYLNGESLPSIKPPKLQKPLKPAKNAPPTQMQQQTNALKSNWTSNIKPNYMTQYYNQNAPKLNNQVAYAAEPLQSRITNPYFASRNNGAFNENGFEEFMQESNAQPRTFGGTMKRQSNYKKSSKKTFIEKTYVYSPQRMHDGTGKSPKLPRTNRSIYSTNKFS